MLLTQTLLRANGIGNVPLVIHFQNNKPPVFSPPSTCWLDYVQWKVTSTPSWPPFAQDHQFPLSSLQ